MTPIVFREANKIIGPPTDLDESQCRSIPAYVSHVKGGSVDGALQVVVAWMPNDADRAAIASGGPVFISMIGGLAPHMLTTTFHDATHPD